MRQPVYSDTTLMQTDQFRIEKKRRLFFRLILSITFETGIFLFLIFVLCVHGSLNRRII